MSHRYRSQNETRVPNLHNPLVEGALLRLKASETGDGCQSKWGGDSQVRAQPSYAPFLTPDLPKFQ